MVTSRLLLLLQLLLGVRQMLMLLGYDSILLMLLLLSIRLLLRRGMLL